MAAKQVVSLGGQDGAVHAYTAEERRAFANHINDVLKDDAALKGALPMNPETNDLFTIVGHGVLLCKLLNKVTAGTVPENKINTKTPLNQFEVNAMHVLALAGAKNIGCQIVNIGPDDLSNGTPHLILGLVWQIVRIDLMNRVKEGMKNMAAKLAPQDDPNNFLNVAPEQNLLRWFNFHLRHAGSPKQVTNFSTDVKDSEAYILLFTQVAPQCADRNAINEPDLTKRAALMLDMAEKAHCRKFVTPADVVAGNAKLNLAFTSFIFLTCPGVLDIDAAEAAERRAVEEEARRKAEEEARKRAEEEAKRKAEEDARRAAEEAARRAAEEEARRKAEEETRRKAEADAAEAHRRAAWDAYNAQQAAAAARPRTQNQRFHYENGYIVCDGNPTLCIAVANDDPGVDGAALVLEVRAAPGALKSQQWDVLSDGTIGSRLTGFLFTVQSDNPQPGVPVVIMRRTMNPAPHQRWAWRRDGFLVPQHANMVLEAPVATDGNVYPRIPLRTWALMP